MKTAVHNFLRRFAVAITLAATVAMSAGHAFATDTITLKDGRTLEGEIVREVDGYIWLKYKLGGLEQETMFTPAEIVKIERDVAAAPVSADPVEKVDADARPQTRPGVPRGAVLTLEEMVGQFMTAYALEQARPMLDQELGDDGERIVVLRIKSGGGALLEIQKLSDEIHNNYKKEFHTVGWIDSAISAAAMTAHCLEEIYFTPQGNYGACTGWYGALTAVKGRDLVEVLHMMEKISARGGYNPLLMRSTRSRATSSSIRRAGSSRSTPRPPRRSASPAARPPTCPSSPRRWGTRRSTGSARRSRACCGRCRRPSGGRSSTGPRPPRISGGWASTSRATRCRLARRPSRPATSAARS